MTASALDWRKVAAPLLAFGNQLEVRPERWGELEEWQVIKADEGPYSHSQISKAREELLGLINAYRGAVKVELELCNDNREVNYPNENYDWAPELGQERPDQEEAAEGERARLREALEMFLQKFNHHEDVFRLTLKLNKVALAGRLLGGRIPRSGTPEGELAATVILFPKALQRWFLAMDNLPKLGENWSRSGIRKWLLLIPGWRADEAEPRRRLLSGRCLSLFGGAPSELPDEEFSVAPTSRAMKAVNDGALADLLARVGIAPFHLQVAGEVPAKDEITAPLRWQAAGLTALYLAESHRQEEERGWVATYTGAQRSVSMNLGAAALEGQPLSTEELAGVEAWASLWRWVFDDTGFPDDRLPVLQNVVCRESWGEEPETLFRRLLPRMPAVVEQAKESWKAFVEHKVDLFFAHLQKLEDHVAATARGFAEQTEGLLERLSKTMLAAVAVLIAALVVPAVKEGKIDPLVLSLAVLVYAGYVLAFPLLYGMILQWQQHKALKRAFEKRQERFERQLPKHRVDEIGREPIDSSVTRYRWWFRVTVVIYLLLAGALVWVFCQLDGLEQLKKLLQQETLPATP